MASSYRERREYRDYDGSWRYEERTYDHIPLRRSRHGLVFGVCQGFANWSGIPVGLLRIGFVIALICTGFFPLGFAYLVAAIVMKPERN
jgi:phage shock protein PspC (stress-responsive transcriptional regulator)